MCRRRVPSTVRLAGAFVAALAMFAALSVGSMPRRATADPAPCTISPILVNSCRPWVGAAVNSYPNVGTDLRSQIANHEQRIGRQLDIVHDYRPAGTSSLTADEIYFATRPNTYLFVNWKPATDWTTANGSDATVNARIDSMAASVASVAPAKIFMTIFHEPENDVSYDPNCPNVTYKGTSGTPSDYRAMWANVEQRFAADGVTNVVWAMDYMNYPPWNCLVPDLYPGDNLVDWIVFNAYQTGDTDVSWVNRVSNIYNILTSQSSPDHDYLSKPWGIVEWGIHQSTQVSAYAYYAQVKAAIDADTFPKLDMYMVYDAKNLSTGDGGLRVAYDRYGNYDPAEQAAYNALVNDPLLTGDGTGGTSPSSAPQTPADQSSTVATDSTEPTVSTEPTTETPSTDPATSATDSTESTTETPSTDPATSPTDSTDSTTETPSTDPATSPTDSTESTAETPTPTPTTDPATSPTDSTDSTTETPTPTPTTTTTTTETATPTTAPTTETPTTAPITETPTPTPTPTPETPSPTATSDPTTETSPTDSTQPTSQPTSTDVPSPTDVPTSTGIPTSTGAAPEAPTDPVTSPTQTAPPAPDTTSPSAPSGLSGTAPDAHTVSLTWDASSDDVGVSSYAVYRNGELLTTTGDTSFTDGSVQDASTYIYTVTASDSAGNVSPSSDPAIVTTPDATPPSAPTSLTATVASTGPTVMLTWNPSSDNVAVNHYAIYRGAQPIATTTGTSYVDTATSDASTYVYWVAAIDAAGNTSFVSNTATATTPDITAPTTPAGVTATAASTGHSVTVQWADSTDNVGVTGYTIYRGVQPIATTSGTSYTDSGLTDGTGYSYAVAASDAAGNHSNTSSPVTVSTPDVTVPTTPAGLTATLSGASVQLRWAPSTDNVGVTSYGVYRDGYLIATVATSAYTDSAASQAKKHGYTIKARDAAGNSSAASAAVSVTVPDLTPPTAPTNLVATGGTKAVSLSWTKSSDNVGVAGYYLYRNGSKVATLSSTATSYTNSGLAATTTYSYVLYAYDAAHNLSAASNAASAKTK